MAKKKKKQTWLDKWKFERTKAGIMAKREWDFDKPLDLVDLLNKEKVHDQLNEATFGLWSELLEIDEVYSLSNIEAMYLKSWMRREKIPFNLNMAGKVASIKDQLKRSAVYSDYKDYMVRSKFTTAIVRKVLRTTGRKPENTDKDYYRVTYINGEGVTFGFYGIIEYEDAYGNVHRESFWRGTPINYFLMEEDIDMGIDRIGGDIEAALSSYKYVYIELHGVAFILVIGQ